MAYPEITGTIEPLEPTDKQKQRARIAEALKALQKAGNLVTFPTPFTGETGLMGPRSRSGLGDVMFWDAQKAFEKAGQGDSPWGGPDSWNPLDSYVKAGRTGDAAAMVGLPLDWTPMGKGGGAVVGAVRKHGDIFPEKLSKKLAEELTKNPTLPSGFTDKVAQWLTRSAGRQDPLLEAARPFTVKDGLPEPHDPFRYLRGPGMVSDRTRELSAERGLPPAPEGSVQEVVDAAVLFQLNSGVRPGDDVFDALQAYSPDRVSYFPRVVSKETGILPENLKKLTGLMQKDTILAREGLGMSTVPGAALRGELERVGQWAANQPADKLQKMTIPQMFQAAEKDNVRLLREFEKTQRGDVETKLAGGLEWQKLRPEHLQREGKLQAHCVGEYCGEVKSGRMEIYSLRDEKNKPLVTLSVNKIPPPDTIGEIVNRLDGDEYSEISKAFGESGQNVANATLALRFYKEYIHNNLSNERVAQIFGPHYEISQIKAKANSVPAKYMNEIKEFMDKKGWDYKDSYEWEKIVQAQEAGGSIPWVERPFEDQIQQMDEAPALNFADRNLRFEPGVIHLDTEDVVMAFDQDGARHFFASGPDGRIVEVDFTHGEVTAIYGVVDPDTAYRVLEHLE